MHLQARDTAGAESAHPPPAQQAHVRKAAPKGAGFAGRPLRMRHAIGAVRNEGTQMGLSGTPSTHQSTMDHSSSSLFWIGVPVRPARVFQAHRSAQARQASTEPHQPRRGRGRTEADDAVQAVRCDGDQRLLVLELVAPGRLTVWPALVCMPAWAAGRWEGRQAEGSVTTCEDTALVDEDGGPRNEVQLRDFGAKHVVSCDHHLRATDHRPRLANGGSGMILGVLCPGQCWRTEAVGKCCGCALLLPSVVRE